jgi:glycosyltransferase involved in cell wall biosynthesis
MLISVIVPTRNRKALLRQALDSVATQNAPGVEIETIVIDNGSTDRTLEMLAMDYPGVLRLASDERGSSPARNAGMRAAKGEWFAFLDDDDVWLPGKIARCLSLSQEHPEARCVWTAATVCDWRLAPLRKWTGPDLSHGPLTCAAFLRDSITPSAILMHRDVYAKVGDFDPALLRGQDLDYFCRTILAGFSFAAAPEEMVLYRLPERPTPQTLYRSYVHIAPLTARYMEMDIPGRPSASERRALLRHVRGYYADQLIQASRTLRQDDTADAREALILALRVSPLHALKSLLKSAPPT